jgi:hypothetical protein
MRKVLQSVYPEHEWLEWRFVVPKRWWHNDENQRKFVRWAVQHLKLQHASDIKSVSSQQIIDLGGACESL